MRLAALSQAHAEECARTAAENDRLSGVNAQLLDRVKVVETELATTDAEAERSASGDALAEDLGGKARGREQRARDTSLAAASAERRALIATLALELTTSEGEASEGRAAAAARASRVRSLREHASELS